MTEIIAWAVSHPWLTYSMIGVVVSGIIFGLLSVNNPQIFEETGLRVAIFIALAWPFVLSWGLGELIGKILRLKKKTGDSK